MGRFWNRNKDPRTAEELMIAEYQRNLEELKNQKEENSKLVRLAMDDSTKYQKEVESLQGTIATLEDRIDLICSQAAGIIDLHEERTIYKVSMWDVWDMKRHCADSNVLRRWSNFPKIRLINSAQKEQFEGYSTMLGIQEATAELIQVPTPSGGHRKCLFAMGTTDTLIRLDQEFTTGKWLCMGIGDLTDAIYDKLKSRLLKAAKDLEEEAKKDDE